MNWTMIGAVGELLGAVGVIVTLGYLARQVRANTRAMRQEAEREAFDRRKHWLTPEFRAELEEEMATPGKVFVPLGSES